MDNCVIYTRISTNNNSKEEELKLNNQLNNCYNFCKNRNINVTNIIKERGSSWKNNRQYKLNDLIINNRNINIIINSIDRFSRYSNIGYKWLENAKNNNICIYFVEEGLNTDIVRNLILIKQKILMAEEESNSMSERIKLSIKSRRKKGELFGPIPYGKKSIKKKNKKIYVDNKLEIDIIRFIIYARNDVFRFSLLNKYLNDIKPGNDDPIIGNGFSYSNSNECKKLSYTNIAIILNSYDIYKRGKKWTGNSIRKICFDYNRNNSMNNINTRFRKIKIKTN